MPEQLPVLVDEPGLYLMRNGRKVTIHEIRKDTSYFEAKGSIWRKPDKMGNNPTFDIWHVSGRNGLFGESGWDIVKKLKGDSCENL